MWVLLPLKVRLGLIVFVSIVVGFSWAFFEQDISIFNILRRMLISISLVAIAGTAIGLWKKSWTIPCKLVLGNWWYPDLNGEWSGMLTSSYGEGDERTEVNIEVTIDQRWSHISVTSKNSNDYSKSIALHVIPEKRDGETVLWTHYKGTVNLPEPTDAAIFFGSTRMVYDRKSDSIEGLHWTNRAWQKGLNTAGSFSLKRVEA